MRGIIKFGEVSLFQLAVARMAPPAELPLETSEVESAEDDDSTDEEE